MKAMILIAGSGTRLQPLTHYVPKCCLPIAGIPLLHIWIRKLEGIVTSLFLNPSHGAKYVKNCFMRSSSRIPTVTIRPEREPIGTAQTLLQNKDWVDGEDFLVIYGDVLTDLNLEWLIKTHVANKAMLTAVVCETTVPEHKGIVTIDENGWVTDFAEKPQHPVSNLAFSGIFVAKAEFIDHIGKDDTDLGFDVFPVVMKQPKTCYVYADPSVYLKDIGTIPDYLQCQEEWRRIHEDESSLPSNNR